MEIWKEIKDYPLYQISNLGRVKSLKFGKEKILKAGLSKTGYLVVVLTNIKAKSFYVHRLVAIHFVDNENNEKYRVVDHINNNRSDNSFYNLKWTNNRENTSKDRPRIKSKYLGVFYSGTQHSYFSAIYIKDKAVWLGGFTDDQEYLSKIYNNAVKSLHLYNGNNKAFRELVRGNLI